MAVPHELLQCIDFRELVGWAILVLGVVCEKHYDAVSGTVKNARMKAVTGCWLKGHNYTRPTFCCLLVLCNGRR